MSNIIKTTDIQNRIFTIRGKQVMLDSDLAELYNVSTGRLNEQVKRNIERFPSDFMFQLTQKEWENLKLQDAITEEISLRSQNATLNKGRGKHRKYLPYVFTEQGVAMLSAVLRSEAAVKVSIQIMHAFVEMKKFISVNAGIFQRLDKVEQKLIEHDKDFNKVFKALEDKSIKPKQGIFFNGQIFDSYKLTADIIRSAKSSIILIDNFVDDSVLMLFTKRKTDVTVTIYTKSISKILKQDLLKYNAQYQPIEIKQLKTAHDRFMIIDGNTVYHFGASLKDLGKKWFAFSKLEIDADDILEKLG